MVKLSVKFAGLCSSGTFLVTAMPAFFQKIALFGLFNESSGTLQGVQIIETLIFSLMGSIMAGAIGYVIGDILSHPDAKPTHTTKEKPNGTPPEEESSIFTETGNETFLDDLASAPSTSTPKEVETTTAADISEIKSPEALP